MNKSVLLVSCVYPPEPVVSARLSSDIRNAIIQNGCRIKVFHPRPTRPEGFDFKRAENIDGDEVIAESYTCPASSLLGRFRESISFGVATFNYIKEHTNDFAAIYANTWPLFSQYYLATAAIKYKIPYYIHVHDIYPESYCHKMPKVLGKLLYNLLIPIDKYVLRNAKGVFTISPAMKNYLAKSRGIEDSKVLLVRNWQDDKAYIEAYKPIGEKHEKTNMMYLGSINPTANVTLILQAVAGLNKEKYHLSIIGNGSEKEHCQELAKQLGIEAFFDTVTPEQVAAKQSEADVLVLCLKKGVAQTATPSKLTAYMLTGRPIIASVDLDSDCANIIREAGCGVVVEPENKDALSEAIKTLAGKSVDEMNSLGKSAFEYAKSHLSKDRNLKILVDTLLAN